ncbi:transporter substrate-binding domain-containing protein [Rhodoligotrophos defluvii]|uniref:transporter substrate-binding domain-containing protein n=1 Tax=Rhodoligotrophos defluvii TaxID=2561934 RepID=UPI0014857A03|nr:transporter substrate-binding domain-containing protein [Rhodoligotrophos defluvii]
MAASAAAPPIRSQPSPEATAQAPLTVGTMAAPPFAMQARSGQWSGISIDLWALLAKELQLQYRLVEYPTLEALIDAVARGEIDVAAAALTITAARERMLDFSQPYYVTGLSIAVPTDGQTRWLALLRAASALGLGQAAASLLVIALFVALAMLLIEHFSRLRGPRGEHGLWWAAHAPAHQQAIRPQTWPGRMLGALAAALLLVSFVSFGVTLALSWLGRSERPQVSSISDIAHVRVGTVSGSSSADYLERHDIRFTGFPNAAEGLTALRDGKLDAFIFDKPLLSWVVLQQFSSSVEVLDTTFDLQSYALALKQNSPLRSRIDPLVIEIAHSEQWQHVLFRYLGDQ